MTELLGKLKIPPEAPAAPPPHGGATSGPAKPVPRWPANEDPSSSPGRHLRAGRGELGRVDDHPFAVLHLLDAHQVVAVVGGSVEAQRTLDGLDAVLLQPVGHGLVVQALGGGDGGFQDLPGRERSRGLHLHRGVGEVGLGRALAVGLDELGGARARAERRVFLEDRDRQRAVGFRQGHERPGRRVQVEMLRRR